MVTDSVGCLRNVGHTDGMRPLVSAVAVMFNRTILCDVTINARCVHHLRNPNFHYSLTLPERSTSEFAQSFILQWLLYEHHASGSNNGTLHHESYLRDHAIL
jgi:hypothetical protein